MNPTSVARATLGGESLFRGYRPPPGVYDEMFAADGTLRDTWREFVQLLDALGPQELDRRWDQARAIIREDGVTYNVHGDPQGRDRRWELDALPLVLRSDEWSTVSAGLIQRARLLGAILADLYGPQKLVRDGHLPGELVFAHPNFLRPCHGWPVPNDCYLHLYAAHLARSPEGRWWVVADRTQAPVGAGYAVENRIVIARMIPHVFHHCQVHRLAGFFITLRDTLGRLAAHNRDRSQTVLLSPGPSSPTYFEDSYLARYLGYTLVEGEDLTVRDNRVFLKTLGGLVNVDAVLRRVRDEDCDPLELASQRRLGVTGLCHAARKGNVALANALGSGLMEAPAMMAFLPALCRALLGEELQIPSARTWWCGDETSLAFVLSHLEGLLIRTANPDPHAKPLLGASLSKSEQQALAARIKAAPARFVAQEVVVRSTAPVWSGGGLRPGHVALRAFLVAAGDSYQVMPGALAHVSTSTEGLGESLFASHGSKDVWVLADGPVAPLTLLQPAGATLVVRRSANDLPSRVADNLYWLGRHAERAESSARLLRSIFTRLLSESTPGSVTELAVLFRAIGGTWPPADAPDASAHGSAAFETALLNFLYDPQQAGSLRFVVAALAPVATAVRDRISLDTWRILQRISDDFHPGYPLGVVSLADILAMLNQMILNFSAFGGVAMENMTRGPGWQFLDLGRRIERALNTIRLLRSTLSVPGAHEHAVLEALLEIADSSMTYRNRYATNLQLPGVVDLLMADESNPRSVAYQLVKLVDHVERLPRQTVEPLNKEQRLVLTVLSAIRLADVIALAEVAPDGVRQQLDTLLNHLGNELLELASIISQKYLVHAGPARQLAEIQRG